MSIAIYNLSLFFPYSLLVLKCQLLYWHLPNFILVADPSSRWWMVKCYCYGFKLEDNKPFKLECQLPDCRQRAHHWELFQSWEKVLKWLPTILRVIDIYTKSLNVNILVHISSLRISHLPSLTHQEENGIVYCTRFYL